jgi:hypothetical protein
MKTIIKFFLLVFVCYLSGQAQVTRGLTKSGIKDGRIHYFETYDSFSAVLNRVKILSSATFKLKNMKTGMIVQKIDSSFADEKTNAMRIYFISPTLREQQDCEFILAINDSIFISTDSSMSSGWSSLKFDIKPSLDASKAQELDVDWNYNTFHGFQLHAKGYFSTMPDSAALNSIQWNAGYQYVLALLDGFKYLGIKGQMGGEHPQDFSQTNIVGSFSLSTVLPFTDQLARFLAGDDRDASIGILIQPALDLVWKTTVKDSSYLRGAVHGNWNIPIRQGQYMSIYGVAYFQDKFRPRSYIELNVTQTISPSTDVIVKWINGELPPLFQRNSDLRLGLSFKK